MDRRLKDPKNLILISLIALLTLAGTAMVIWHAADKTRVNCARHIEELPSELYHQVNTACRDWLRNAHVISPEALRDWLSNERIIYSGEPIEGERGRVQRLGSHILFSVPFCLDEREEGKCVHFIVGARRTAYHEAGHLVLMAAGIHTSEHHALMDAYRLCPGECPDNWDDLDRD